MNVRITYIHPFDAQYSDRDQLLDVVGQAYGIQMSGHELYQFEFHPVHLRTQYVQFMWANFERL